MCFFSPVDSTLRVVDQVEDQDITVLNNRNPLSTPGQETTRSGIYLAGSDTNGPITDDNSMV